MTIMLIFFLFLALHNAMHVRSCGHSMHVALSSSPSTCSLIDKPMIVSKKVFDSGGGRG